jgi:hypothetical protein
MQKHPAEVFGSPVDDRSPRAQGLRDRRWCPFVDAPCEKQTRLLPYPMGVCSVCYGDAVVALSPRRFLQDRTVFLDIADHHFGARSDLLLFDEVSVPAAQYLGRFDFVLAKHKPLSGEIDDFVVIEMQTGQTTSTGGLVRALDDFMQGKDVQGTTYPFGLNLADIWKRAFTQVLTKGIVAERWGHKVYWVVQEPVYQNLLDRYHLQGMTYDPAHQTVFFVYDLVRSGDSYRLAHTRAESCTVDSLFRAFRSNFQVPPKDLFLAKLEQKSKQKGLATLELKLR